MMSNEIIVKNFKAVKQMTERVNRELSETKARQKDIEQMLNQITIEVSNLRQQNAVAIASSKGSGPT